MPTTRTITYNDFSKGEYAEIGPYRAPVGSFSGSNVVLYTNGLLGPRAGLHLNTITSGPTPNGKLWGLYSPGKINKTLMLVVDKDIYSAETDTTTLGTVALAASMIADPQNPVIVCWYDPNDNLYITNQGDSCYYINWSDNTLTQLPVRASGTENTGTATLYLAGDRLYAAGDFAGGAGDAVYVSNANDFINFGGGDDFHVGYFNTLKAITEAQNSLLFSSLESVPNLSTGTGWYALVGATPQGDLRRINVNLPTNGQREVVIADSGNTYFFTGWSTLNEDNPFLVTTNGAKFDEETYKHLRLAANNRYGYYNNNDRSLIYVGDTHNDALMRVNGAWSRLSFQVNVSGPVAPTNLANSFLIGYGEAGQDVKIYELLSRPDKPGFVGDQSMPGDNSTVPINAEFELPYFHSEKDVRVRRVIVDFVKWNTGHSVTNNSFVVEVRSVEQYNLPAASGSATPYATTTATWSEAQTLASAGGTLDRFTARVGTQGKGGAFQIAIKSMVGIAVESITVEYDMDDLDGQDTTGGRPR